MILAPFYLQVILMPPTKFGVSWRFCSEEAKNRFFNGSHGGHLGFPIRLILGILIY